MINGPLSYDVRITRGMNGQSTASGSTGNELDMSGFEGVMFILHGSSLMEASTNVSLKASGSTASGGTFVEYDSSVTVAQSTMTTGSFNNKILCLDLYKPLKQYVKPIVAGASSDVAGAFTITALQYGARVPGSTELRDSTYVGGYGVSVGATSS